MLAKYGHIYVKNIYELQELYSASTQVVRQIILTNSANPSDISDFSIRHILQEDTLSSANHVSTIDLSYTTPPKSLKSYNELPVNNKARWDMAYEEEFYCPHNKKKPGPTSQKKNNSISIQLLVTPSQQSPSPPLIPKPTVSLNGPNTTYVFLVTLTPPTGYATRYLLRCLPSSNYAYSSPLITS